VSAALPIGKLPSGLVGDLLRELDPLLPDVRLGPAIGENGCAIAVPPRLVVAVSDPIICERASIRTSSESPLGPPVPHRPRHGHRAEWCQTMSSLTPKGRFVLVDIGDRPWPVEDYSLERNEADLQEHEADFAERKGFTYTVLDPDDKVIGCLYVYAAVRTDSPDAGANVRSWIRADYADRDVDLYRAVMAWLADAWPFNKVVYATRWSGPG